MYRALYDFKSNGPGVLSFKKDEIFQVSEKIDENWLTGKNDSGDTGLLPAAYMEKQDAQKSKLAKGQPYFVAYDYKGDSSLQLSVVRGQKLVLIKEIDKCWWNMKNEEGKVGLVPKDYLQNTRPQPVAPNEELDSKAKMEALKSTDRAIEKMYQEAAASGGHYTSQQRNTLQKLVAHRKSLVESTQAVDSSTASSSSEHKQKHHHHHRQAPAPPTHNVDQKSNYKRRKAPTPPISPTSSSTVETKKDASSGPTSPHHQQQQSQPQQQQQNQPQQQQNITLDAPVDTSSYVVVEKKLNDIIKEFDTSVGTELVEIVRTNCDISHSKSLTAVQVVLEFVGSTVPQLQQTMSALLEAVHKSQVDTANIAAKLECSADHERLSQLFEQITDVKNDSQQRGWAVHDDLSTITSCLEELLQRLGDADPTISLSIIKEDKYENILTLVTYYQMETRASLRLLLLQLFGLLCGLEIEVVSVLLNSVLPNELGRDIHDNMEDRQKVLYSALVCTMIFSTAEAPPVSVYDQFDVYYVTFLLDTIESSAADSSMEEIADGFLNLLLSFNQHFGDPANNLVMNSLMKQPNRKVFGEKLILLVNREEDPVVIKEPNVPNSLTKMLMDLFSDSTTASLFYTNDLLVVIDIITRQLTDLNPDDKVTHFTAQYDLPYS